MKILLVVFWALSCAGYLAAETEQSVTVSPVESKTFRQDGKTVTERTVQIKERIAISGARNFKAAIFIANRIPKLQDKTSSFEDLVTARVSDLGFQVISKEVVSDSLRKFDPQFAGTNPSPDSLDAKLADQSSALRLAQGLGADYLLIATITSIGTHQHALDAYGVKRITAETTLRVTYKVVDGQTGATLAAHADKASVETNQTSNSVEENDDSVNELLDKASDLVADSLRGSIEQNRISATAPAAALAWLNIDVEAADLVVPDVRIDDEHTVRISNSEYKVHPLNATVEVDGVAVGTAPGKIQVKPGFSKLRLTREGFKPWERVINAVDGQTLTVAMELSPEGYARWKDATAFLNILKNGAKLTDAEVQRIEGDAQRLRQSGYRVDTKGAPVTNNIFR